MRDEGSLSLVLTGDVMTGRGIDQIQRYPSHPRLHEDFVKSAETYIELAEQVNGEIPRQVSPDYIWGDALATIKRNSTDIRIVNLETSITVSEDYAAKGIHYRMNPNNIDCITEAMIDCCLLANNHMLDWGRNGLQDTIDTLNAAGVGYAGAGPDGKTAMVPWVKEVPHGERLLVFGIGHRSSGIPQSWAAGHLTPGIEYISDLSKQTVQKIAGKIDQIRKDGDFIIVSIHWGPNWGYQISEEEITFTHALIDTAKVDLIHGHSCHHRKAAEVYNGKMILYDCGDFINDYEGIQGHEAFHPELVLMYRLTFSLPEKRLTKMQVIPFRLRKFRLESASAEETELLVEILNREYGRFGGQVTPDDKGRLTFALS